jgi:hypothetical protein
MSSCFARVVWGLMTLVLAGGALGCAGRSGHSTAAAAPALTPVASMRNMPSTCPRTTAPSTPGTIAVEWRTEPFVSLFWAIDQASDWDEGAGPSPYAEFFDKHLPRAAGDAEMLKAYGRLRRDYSQPTTPEPDPDPAYPSDMLPPKMTSSERFVHAFLCAGSTDAAAAALSMSPADQELLATVFAHFRPRLEVEFGRAEFLARAATDMKALAEQAKMSEFLFRMGRFFGTGSAVPVPLYVELVWAPPNAHKATAIDDHMIIPISEKIANAPKELASWVGVTVHEFGHQFLAYVPEDQRRRASNQIVAAGGLLRRRHSNVIDEATQAALGNLLFLRERLPSALDEKFVYSYEPSLPYPDLIDSLSRRAEPLVRDAIAKGETFDGPYLDALLAAQAVVAPPLLEHHSHVALLFVGGADERTYFDGLFWRGSRFVVNDAAEFAKKSARAPSISRWVVVTMDELASNRDELSRTMPDVARLEQDLVKKAGCVRASQRTSGAWDVAVVGRDLDGVRQTLIAVQRGLAPREARPFCLPLNATAP